MTVQHLYYDPGTRHGGEMHNVLQRTESAVDAFLSLGTTIEMMIDGDVNNVDNYTYLKNKIGATDNETAKSIRDEYASAVGQLNNAMAALQQLFNKTR